MCILLLGTGAFWYLHTKPIAITGYVPQVGTHELPGIPFSPEPNPDPQDNLNTGPIDEQKMRLYRNEMFGFEIKYPAHFKGERWILIANYKIGVKFTGKLNDGREAWFGVTVSPRQEDLGIVCGEGGCDGVPEEITIAGQKWTRPQGYYLAWVKHNNTFYAIGVDISGHKKDDSIDLLFKEFGGSFHFLK